MKTIVIVMLGMGWWLAASPLWADNHGESATKCEMAPIVQLAPWIVANDSADTNIDWESLDAPPSLDLDLYPQSEAVAAITAAPRLNSISTDSDEGHDSDLCASFILIGLGGGVLISIRWRMLRTSPADAISAR